jgi:hypothetical protein
MENILKIRRSHWRQKPRRALAAQGISAVLQQSGGALFVLQKLKVTGRMCAVNILP